MKRIHVRTLAVVLSVASAVSLAVPLTAPGQSGPIKIGLLIPLTGAADTYVRRVEKVGGKLQNTVVATFPAVSQFWTYNPEPRAA